VTTPAILPVPPSVPPLISPQALLRLQSDAPEKILICDCSFDLVDPALGARRYAEGHLPGAVYVNLDTDLSSAKTGKNGRHPLPAREPFAARMAALGASDATHIIAYDASDGQYAARLWWLLRRVGHTAVSVLDGGVNAWQAAGLPLTSEVPTPTPGTFTVRPAAVEMVDYATLRASLGQPDLRIVDARAPDRFRGENETMDAIGGHIPGAKNRFFRDNLTASGTFKPAHQLRAEFAAVLGNTPASACVHQCGSGVTACHNLLAMEVAGLTGATLYPGSWSEWSAQPDAPIATGALAG